MNRQQKRNYIKALQSKGILKADAEIFLNYKQMADMSVSIPEGTKVKLNMESIKNHPDYPKLRDKYKSWIEVNSDNVFTVEYSENKKVDPVTVCLAEDTTKPKWLFWVGDLTVVEEVSK